MHFMKNIRKAVVCNHLLEFIFWCKVFDTIAHKFRPLIVSPQNPTEVNGGADPNQRGHLHSLTAPLDFTPGEILKRVVGTLWQASPPVYPHTYCIKGVEERKNKAKTGSEPAWKNKKKKSWVYYRNQPFVQYLSKMTHTIKMFARGLNSPLYFILFFGSFVCFLNIYIQSKKKGQFKSSAKNANTGTKGQKGPSTVLFWSFFSYTKLFFFF